MANKIKEVDLKLAKGILPCRGRVVDRQHQAVCCCLGPRAPFPRRLKKLMRWVHLEIRVCIHTPRVEIKDVGLYYIGSKSKMSRELKISVLVMVRLYILYTQLLSSSSISISSTDRALNSVCGKQQVHCTLRVIRKCSWAGRSERAEKRSIVANRANTPEEKKREENITAYYYIYCCSII